jgi:formylglycine-generating enzyme required for sulfatase activity
MRAGRAGALVIFILLSSTLYLHAIDQTATDDGTFTAEAFNDSTISINEYWLPGQIDRGREITALQDIKIRYKFWTLLGEPIYDVVLYWDYSGSFFHIDWDELGKYPDLLKRARAVTPYNVVLTAAIYNKNLPAWGNEWDVKLLVDLTSPAGVWGTSLVATSPDWDTWRTYGGEGDVVKNLFAAVKKDGPVVIDRVSVYKMDWPVAEIESIYNEVLRRRYQITEAKTESADDFWGTSTPVAAAGGAAAGSIPPTPSPPRDASLAQTLAAQRAKLKSFKDPVSLIAFQKPAAQGNLIKGSIDAALRGVEIQVNDNGVTSVVKPAADGTFTINASSRMVQLTFVRNGQVVAVRSPFSAVGQEMVVVNPGKATIRFDTPAWVHTILSLGSCCETETIPASSRSVTYSLTAPLSVMKTEVTFDQFDAFADATGWPKPKDYGKGRGRLPVTNVGREDVARFANWLSVAEGLNAAYTISPGSGGAATTIRPIAGSNGYRLPTGDEFRYLYHYGRSYTVTRVVNDQITQSDSGPFDVSQFEWVGQHDPSFPTFVGSKAADPLGLFDIRGNVGELVANPNGAFAVAGNGAETGLSRVWDYYDYDFIRPDRGLGFRLVRGGL